MKVFRFILIIIGVFLLLLFTIPIFLPSSSYVERTIEINKPIDEVFMQVIDFENYTKWNPWVEMEQELVFNVLNNDPQEGSKIEWEGDTIGSGYLMRTKVVENELIESDLVFVKPWESNARDIMKFEPILGGTKIIWANEMELVYPFGRYMSFVMENFIGNDFEKGLAKLKVHCDTAIKTTMYDISEDNAKPTFIYFVSDSTDIDSKSIEKKLNSAYLELLSFFKKNKLEDPTAPIAITKSHDNNKWHFDAAFKTQDTSHKTSGRIQKGELKGSKLLKCVYIGSYSEGHTAYKQIHNYMKVKGYVPDGRAWEEYVNDPRNTPQEKLITHIYYPVKVK